MTKGTKSYVLGVATGVVLYHLYASNRPVAVVA